LAKRKKRKRRATARKPAGKESSKAEPLPEPAAEPDAVPGPEEVPELAPEPEPEAKPEPKRKKRSAGKSRQRASKRSKAPPPEKPMAVGALAGGLAGVATEPEGETLMPQAAARKRKGAKAPKLEVVPKPEEKPEKKPAAKKRNGNGAQAAPATAESMASMQREISVAEFFQKNRHLLGFDNPRKALLTAIKEAVDNSLDACEEARILPDIRVEIRHTRNEERFVIVVQDNGPGIMKEQIGYIFGKLLYGSKFHRLKMSRGQQGIGISAAGMYGQLTTGKPVKITSRIDASKPAHYYELMINTTKNEPVIVKNEEIDWKHERGTRVEIELVARYQKGRQSIDEYLEETAIACPHVRIVYRNPEGKTRTFRRGTEVLPAEPCEIRPHPYGVELGLLMKMLKDSKDKWLTSFLHNSFSRVSTNVAKTVAKKARVAPKSKPSRLRHEDVDRIYKAINETKLMAPPTDCLSPIGLEAIVGGLKKQIKAEFYAAVSRRPAVYRGNPFLVEAGIAYGGEQDPEGLARLLRFANRVPLLYQKSACAIYDAVVDTGWRNYRIAQSRGALPAGPITIMVHFASSWVPFTSESKEAIADYPEIHKEMRLALQECGRRVSQFLGRRRRAIEDERKRSYIDKYIPHIGVGLREILGFSAKEEASVVKKLRGLLEKSRDEKKLEENGSNGNGNNE